MTGIEPVEPDAILPRGCAFRPRPGPVAAPGCPGGAGSSPRGFVPSPKDTVSRSALAFTAVAAAKAAGTAVRMVKANGAPVGPEVVGRIREAPALDATLEVSWTRVEMRWRW